MSPGEAKAILSHEWELCGGWGVVFGVSRCRKCGRLASEERMRTNCLPVIFAEGQNVFGETGVS